MRPKKLKVLYDGVYEDAIFENISGSVKQQELKIFHLGTQEENLAKINKYKDEPKKSTILNEHFNEYLQHVFRILKVYENSDGTGSRVLPLKSIKE